MASLTFVLRADNLNNRLRRSLEAPGGVVRADVQRRARNVRDEARALLQLRSEQSTGEIASTIRFVTAVRPEGIVAQVGSDHPAALGVEQGTGIYGPHRTPIVPRVAKFMRFIPRGGSGYVYAKKVRGQPGKHYLRDALRAAAD